MLKRVKYSRFYAIFAKVYTCKLLIRIKITLNCQINWDNFTLVGRGMRSLEKDRSIKKRKDVNLAFAWL